jgi:hypothetical protein
MRKLSPTQSLPLVFVLVALVAGCLPQQAENHGTTATVKKQDFKNGSSEVVETDADASAEIEVTLEVKFNGRATDLEFSIECGREGSVFDATLKACTDNEVEFDFVGNGPQTRFVKAIGGVANEKAAGDNWTYRVNQKLGSVGCGMAKIEKGDRITWSFGKYDLED